jgi:hypothetical protein
VRSPHHQLGQQQAGNNNCHASSNPATNNHPRLNKDDSIKISIENTNTCTDSLVTALDDETLLITDFLGDTGESSIGIRSTFFKEVCDSRFFLEKYMFYKHASRLNIYMI